MKNKTVTRMLGHTQLYLKHKTPTFLTFLGAVGVVATAVLASMETPKALRLLKEASDEKGEELSKLETVTIAAPVYIPSILTGAATITCIFGANVLNQRQQASLASAYALLNNYHKEYRNKLIELHGEEADEEVRTAMAREHCDYHQIGLDTPDGKVLFYDEISGESFYRYEREIMDAEYHLNRNFVLRGYASLNEFYQFLGLPKTEYGDSVGWTVTDGYSWIDFEHHLIPGDDGGPDIYSIDMIFPPDHDYLMEWE